MEPTASAGFASFLVLTLLFAFYFLPGAVAMVRGHQNRVAIVILNIFLGWTFIGWVVALVWAFTQVTTLPEQPQGTKQSDS